MLECLLKGKKYIHLENWNIAGKIFNSFPLMSRDIHRERERDKVEKMTTYTN